MNKQFSALVRTRLGALTASLFRSSRKTQKNSLLKKIGLGFLIAYVFGAFAMMGIMMFGQLAKPLYNMGVPWLYFTLTAVMSFGMMFIGSIFSAQTQLYEAKDNELLLSMPVKPSQILGSRLIMLLVLNLVIEIFIAVPAGLIWLAFNPYSAVGIISYILIFAALPFFSLSISCAVGALLAAIASRIKNKSLVITALSMVALLAYFSVIGRINEYITMIAQNGMQIAESFSAVLPVYWIGEAIAYGKLSSLAFTLLIMLIPPVIVYYILSKTFIKIATQKRGFAKVEYHAGELKAATPKAALLRRELAHLVSSPMYMMNAGLGVVFTVAIAVMFAIKRDMVDIVAAEMPFILDFLPTAAAAILSMIATTNMISAPSVSLEGRTLWIARSIPVSSADILMAKVEMHMVVTIPPTFIASAVLAFVVSPNALQLIVLFILPQLVNVFCAFFGVIINLRFPRFDWISETAAVKQSMSTFVAMFGSFAIVIAVGIIGYFSALIMPIDVYILICCAIFAAVDYLMYRYTIGRGAKVFESLS